MEQPEFYTTKEVAALMNKSVMTVHKYVREKKLTPVEDLWGGYRGLLFEKKQIDRFLAEMPPKNSGLSLNEAAKVLKTNRSTVQTYVNEKLLPAEKQESRGREITVVQEASLKEFAEIHRERLREDRLKQRPFYNRQKQEAVYQRFSSPSISEARLFREESGEWFFLEPKTSRIFSYNEGIFEHKLTADYLVEFGKRTGTPGYAKLEVPLRYSLTYQLMDLLYQHAKVANMYMEIENSKVMIYVKDCMLSEVTEELAMFVSSHMKEGTNKFQRGRLLIESTEQTLTVRLSSETKKWIKQQAEEKGISMQEIASEIIEMYRKQLQ